MKIRTAAHLMLASILFSTAAGAQTVLRLNGFAVFVETWQSRLWDPAQHRFIKANGTGRLAFQCQSPIPLPFTTTNVVEHQLTVVTLVQHPAHEISLADARRLDMQATIGGAVTVLVPAGIVVDAQLANAVHTYIHWRLNLSGGMPVRFNDLTVAPTTLPGVGDVSAGVVSYAAAPGTEAASFRLGGFSGLINTVTITTQSIAADIVLEMPASIVDAGTGHAGRVALGAVTVNRACEFRKEQPALAYGPWSAGNTGIEISGAGVVADFDDAWSPPSSATGQTLPPEWKGVALGPGATIPEQTVLVISNTGYTRAPYDYPRALVTAQGLSARLSLGAAFRFQSLQPAGYSIQFTRGTVELVDSAVRSGEFDSVISPSRFAVGDENGQPISVRVDPLRLNDKLELSGTPQPISGLSWGDFVSRPAPGGASYYRASGFKAGAFYLAGTYSASFAPLDAADQFVAPNQPVCQRAPTLGVQGLTFCTPAAVEIETPDTPGRKPLRFVPGKDVMPNWVNISAQGVHANLSSFVSEPSTVLDLGPTAEPYYVGKTAFIAAAIGHAAPQYKLDIAFVSSSVYTANMSGAVTLALPVGGVLAFDHMQFTSTAQISGAQVPLDTPLPLTYWGVSLVRNEGATTGAVMNVRTGQIFVTAGGITEPRHFVRPFFLTWGEILADGELGRLVYDYNAAGQRFDGFLFTPTYVKLSDYVAPPASSVPNLRAAGNVSFDLFGAKYVNVKDEYRADLTTPPNDLRLVTLSDDQDPAGAYGASDHALSASWSSDLAQFTFTYGYDGNLQDGFVGTGTANFIWMSTPLPASVVLKSSQICMSVADANAHSLALGPLTRFLSVADIYGCGCIANGQLQRFGLGGRLEADPATSFFARQATSATVQLEYKPTVSTVLVQGEMFLTIFVVGNVQITGSARFSVERNQSAVDGSLDGSFDTSAMLGFAELRGTGRLDWHVAVPTASDAYQSLQGHVGVRIIGPVDGTNAEGGFYIGVNAPKNDAWIINSASSKYRPNSALPTRLTGAYGYGKFGESLNAWVISGGVEVYTGLGAFLYDPPVAFTAIGQSGAHAWGKILGGLGYASGSADLQMIVGVPPDISFAGDLKLRACGAWVVCGTVTLGIEISGDDGLDVSW